MMGLDISEIDLIHGMRLATGKTSTSVGRRQILVLQKAITIIIKKRWIEKNTEAT